jgi:hypothetical protein
LLPRSYIVRCICWAFVLALSLHPSGTRLKLRRGKWPATVLAPD